MIETELNKADVRLTMGGEPTFVSIDDMDGDEWNYTALSEKTKLELATDLLRRLAQESFAPQGVVHFGQGKWYPGEPLPAWGAVAFLARRTANRSSPAISGSSRGRLRPRLHGHRADAHRFIDGGRGGRRRSGHRVRGARARGHPLSPVEGRLAAGERHPHRQQARRRARAQASARAVHPGLEQPHGFRPADQVARAGTGRGHWISSPWPFRDGHMFLLPGDSPIGLPATRSSSLPWEAPDPTEFEPERDPFEPRDELKAADATRASAKRPEEDERGRVAVRRPSRSCTPRCAFRHGTGRLLRVHAAAGAPRGLSRAARTWWFRSPGSSTCRWSSKATSRRATRACASFRSRPTRA